MADQRAWAFMPEQGLRGALVTEREICIPIDTHALHYGTSVIEGIRAYPAPDDGKAKNVFRLDDHLARLWESAREYGMAGLPWTKPDFHDACCEVIAANEQDTYLRPIVFRGNGLGVDPTDTPVWGIICSRPWGRYLKHGLYHDGVSVQVAQTRRAEPDMLPVYAKGSANYVAGALAKQRARADGFGEALLRTPRFRYIAEGTGMNLFIVNRKGRIVTPAPLSSVLLGITRATVMDIVADLFGSETRVVERFIFADELLEAREIFLTGTATEITPVTKVGGHEVGLDTDHCGHAGPMTKAIATYYHDIVNGRVEKYRHWLTCVPSDTEVLPPR
ncbi:MAG: branched-chain-amino-acid transaminase [Candidatus Kerfeldbacteria bacterium]|nr:branched-chain-amino-acid transaminase [Candidatus Kerfeldbacteria bacterium]